MAKNQMKQDESEYERLALRQRIAIAAGSFKEKDFGSNDRKQEQKEENTEQKALASGLRIGVEFVSAIVISVVLGWVLDQSIGTTPWGVIGFFLLGSLAGFLNVYRAAQQMGLLGDATGPDWLQPRNPPDNNLNNYSLRNKKSK